MLVQVDGSVGSQSTQQQRAVPQNAWIKIAALSVVVVLIFSSIAIVFFNNGQTKDPQHLEFIWSYDEKDFNYKLDVAQSDYDSMMKSPIDKEGTTAAERYQIKNGNSVSTVFAVKDYIVVDSYIKKLSSDLTDLYDKAFPSNVDKADKYHYAGYLVSFTQYIKYDDEEASKGYELWRYPLETLYDGKGDCEDKSILAAAILDAVGIKAGIFLIPGHAMVAVTEEISSHPGLHIYNHYMPGETTNSKFWIGAVPKGYENAYFHLYTGYSEEYFTA